MTFSEILATSDLPGGVVNLLTGKRAGLVPHIASHMDVNAIVDGAGDATISAQLRAAAPSISSVTAIARSRPGVGLPPRAKSLCHSGHGGVQNRLASDWLVNQG